ncbi:MAG TPA: ribonuclease Y [Spirochaetia bacterium]|nr:MAG: ribonuclease Y [Spirochaetes bacterium GWB1_36_13]HCL56464.1 ribonuclease Y [Spirochaetia bacterium]
MDPIYILTSLFTGIIIGYLIRYIYGVSNLRSAEIKAKNVIAEAERLKDDSKKEIESLEQKTKNEQRRLDEEKKDFIEKKKEIQSQEQRLVKKEEGLEKKESLLEKKEESIFAKEKNLRMKEDEIDQEKNNLKKELEKIANITREEAKHLLISEIKDEVEKDYYEIIKKREEEAKAVSDKLAKEIIVSAIQRTASEVTADASISTVTLPSDDMKGRIIGREGRNIRTLETMTGVDIIIDDTPEAIVLSCFDPIRREVARLAIEKLISDGRIQPSRIEEVVEKVKTEIEEIIRNEGDNACYELGVQGLSPELKKYIGRLKYRTSYGQNVLSHSKEVAHVSSIIAADLGLDKEVCKRAGLLHDIGKGVIEEDKGHAVTGAELAKRFGENETVVNAILAHHEDTKPNSLEALIIQIADTISASRPGARRDSFESYIKRLEGLENIALGFKKVEKAYAIQAGREIRVLVNSFDTNDEESKILARDVAKKIEEELRYPGQIKVTVIRESRMVEYAK